MSREDDHRLNSQKKAVRSWRYLNLGGRPLSKVPGFRASILMVLMAILSQGYTLPQELSMAKSQVSYLADVDGTVISKSTASAIANALVELPDFGLSKRTDAEGRFSFSQLSIADLVMPVEISVHAQGFGDWKILGVRLVANDTLILEVKLETNPITIVVPEIDEEERFGSDFLKASSLQIGGALNQMDVPLPETIRVRVTGEVSVCNQSLPYTVEVIDFKEYTKNVLPNEWYVTWPRESLRAGAMAAKMYAWQIVADGGRYSDADVYDSVCDQVYIPGVAYRSTNNAIDFTWNWRLTHSANDNLFRTHYLDWYWRCENYDWQGFCMGQWDTRYHAEGNNGYDKLTWDEMLFRYYWDSTLTYIPHLPATRFDLRFYGNGWGDFDRIKILVDHPQDGGLPIDVGDTDFTIEWWMKALASDNASSTCVPGGDHWMDGNVIFDRDVPGVGDHGEYGVSLTNGTIAFGVNNGSISETLCGAIPVADGEWHHIALTRSFEDGRMRIFIDGELDVETIGPGGDISYRDGRTAQDPDQDPYLIIGARKSDQGAAFNGWMDEIRFSNVVRYSQTFQPPHEAFSSDEHTLALYHFNEGYGNQINDLSGAAGGPSNGIRIYGGDPLNGPEWEVSSLFMFNKMLFPLIVQ